MTNNKIEVAFFDIDGTIHEGDTIWEAMHKKIGTWKEEGKKYLSLFLSKKINYEEFARLDAKAWKAQPASVLLEVIKKITIYKETEETFTLLKKFGIKIYLISNGIAQFADHLTTKYELSGHLSNKLIIHNNKLTGEIDIQLPYNGKKEAVISILSKLNIHKKNALAIGDGHADIPMLNLVGHPLFFNPKNKAIPKVYSGKTTTNWNQILNYVKSNLSDD